MGNPELSVVIPTHNRCQRLLSTLGALGDQQLAGARYEVIVVIDAGTDDSEARVTAQRWPFDCTVIGSEGRGAAAARNTGAARARGERLVFLDDDIDVRPGFLAAHLDAADGAVLIGRSIATGLDTGWFGSSVAAWWTRRFGAMARPGYRFGHTDVMSGNMSLPRDLFAGTGGFDAALRCREDYELGYRLVAADVPIRYAAGACGLHHDASTPRRNLARARAEGRADLMIARKHPALFAWAKASNMTAPTTGARVLRWLAFDAPGVAAVVLRAGLAAQSLAETLGLRGFWTRLNGTGRALAYQLGVAEEAATRAALYAMKEAPRPAAPPVLLDLDLSEPAETLRRKVDEVRPDGLSLSLCGKRLASIWPEPGRERLGRQHLDAHLTALLPHWAPLSEVRPFLPDPAAPLPAWVTDPVAAPSGEHLAEVDLDGGAFRSLEARPGFPMRLLVRKGTRPLGWVSLGLPSSAETFRAALRDGILADPPLMGRLIRAGRTTATHRPQPPISVVVCTRDRTDTLGRCLAALSAQRYSGHEIIVVDNAPATDATFGLVAGLPGIRYVREDRPGLDWARNRGVTEARHGIVAFTDDDTYADPDWLAGLAEGFADPAVDFVTGLVAPMKLDTPARQYFEDVYGGMGKGFDEIMRYADRLWPHDLLWASALGVGANMAFRKTVFARAGGFDPALDVGTATRGGGDIEMFHRALARGCNHFYAPSAMVWHEHRADMAALGRQLADNGSGFASYLLAAWRNRTVPRLAILRFAGRAWLLDWILRRAIRPGRHRRGFVLAELRGMARAPRLWRTARMRAAELGAEGTGSR